MPDFIHLGLAEFLQFFKPCGKQLELDFLRLRESIYIPAELFAEHTEEFVVFEAVLRFGVAAVAPRSVEFLPRYVFQAVYVAAEFCDGVSCGYGVDYQYYNRYYQ